VFTYLADTYATAERSAGWGLCRGNPISITNTTEAILTYLHLDTIDHPFLLEKRDKIAEYLTHSLTVVLAQERPRTRDVALAAIGLEVLDRFDLRQDAVDKLLLISNRGGWPPTSGTTRESSLVATYHAMSALRYLGETPGEQHFDWLRSLQRVDDLCSFDPMDHATSLSASSLVLFILAQSPSHRNEIWTHRLAKALIPKLDSAFAAMAAGTREWIGEDHHSHFKIFGYGHALAALNELGHNLFDLNISALVAASEPVPGMSDIFGMQPDRTWVPAALEFAMALKALRQNFDPYRYLESVSNRMSEAFATELAAERTRLAQEAERQALTRAVIDAWEKDLIRQRISIVSAVEDLRTALPEAILNALEERSASVRRRILFLLCWLLSFLPFVVFYLLGKLEVRDPQSWPIMALPLAFPPLVAWLRRLIGRRKKDDLPKLGAAAAGVSDRTAFPGREVP
jgi:hypothetical protein